MSDLYNTIRAAVVDAAGISVNATLEAISGSRHVLPPTYADAPHKHNMTEPDADGVAAWVSIDSAASFANRIEEKLKRAGLAACRTTRRQSRRVSPCGTKSRISLVFWRFQGISPHAPYCGRNTAKRFKFQARQTSVHSPVTFFKPRREKRRKPITDLMIPKTGSIVCLRKA
jgi:hypothetical protein